MNLYFYCSPPSVASIRPPSPTPAMMSPMVLSSSSSSSEYSESESSSEESNDDKKLELPFSKSVEPSGMQTNSVAAPIEEETKPRWNLSSFIKREPLLSGSEDITRPSPVNCLISLQINK